MTRLRSRTSLVFLIPLLLAVHDGRKSHGQESAISEDVVLENLPEAVTATMELRDRWIMSLPAGAGGRAFLVEDVLRWRPNQTVRVAFLGGDAALHADIASVTKQVTDVCSIKLDFGYDASTGNYRRWSTQDTSYSAEIRVSFDQSGYFSLVGTDSISRTIGRPGDPVGGRANQRSLNLGGFDIQQPADWKGTARHEFLHALAFHHEHQSPMGGCDNEFRWQDDVRYRLTRDARGRFVADANGRRPGIYTYLAGFPNFWSRRTIDHNLRQLRTQPGISAGRFDRGSIMLYRFPALFYRSIPSPCAPIGSGEDLSDGDIAGLRYLYPNDPSAVEAIVARQNTMFGMIMQREDLAPEMRKSMEALIDVLKP